MAESVKYNSQDSTSKYGDFIWEFTKRYSVILQVKSTKMTGEWSTASNDKDFVIDYDNGTTEKYEILKMTNKEFWLKHKSSQLEFHLKAQ